MPKIRKSTSLKFAAVAIGVAGIVGLTISSASSLNLAGGTVGAAASVVASCQSAAAGAITVNFDNTFSATTPGGAGYSVTQVSLGNVDTNCNGQKVKVTLTNASGASLGEFTGTVGTTNSFTATAGTISAASVVGTSVVIYN
jgi:hypothetical protein